MIQLKELIENSTTIQDLLGHNRHYNLIKRHIIYMCATSIHSMEIDITGEQNQYVLEKLFEEIEIILNDLGYAFVWSFIQGIERDPRNKLILNIGKNLL